MTLWQRSATPALAQRPISKAALASDHVPHASATPDWIARPMRPAHLARDAGHRLDSFSSGRPSRAWDAQHRQSLRSGSNARCTNAAWKSLAALYMASVIVPARSIRAERVDDLIVEHRPTIGIGVPDLLELATAYIGRLDPRLIARLAAAAVELGA